MSSMPSKGELKKNLKLLKERLEARPMDLDARMRIARTFRLLGDGDDAVAHYGAVARYLSLAGHPLQAIAVLKELLQVNAQHEESLLFLAKLYARTRAADASNRGRVAVPIVDVAAAPAEGGVRALVDGLPETTTGIWRAIRPEQTAELAVIRDADEVGAVIDEDDDDVAEVDDNDLLIDDSRSISARFEDSVLQRVPLFQQLDADAFVALGHAMVLMHAEPEQVVFAEGDPGDSCLVVTDGRARVERNVDGVMTLIDSLGPGDVAGVFALVASDVRQASVIAETALEYFEIDRAAVNKIVASHPSAKKALHGYVRERLFAALTVEVPLFATLSADERHHLADTLVDKSVGADDEVVSAFTENDVFFFVVDGSIAIVEDGVDGDDVERARLHVGDFFACTAGSQGLEAGVAAVARDRATVAIVPHKVFQGVVGDRLEHLDAALGKSARALGAAVSIGTLRR